MNTPIHLSFIIPLYNEEPNFKPLTERLNQVMDTLLPLRCEVVLVDDGSSDTTPQLMNQIALDDARYQAVYLSKNHGHQLAITAGLSCARAEEAIMILDGDLQDPPELALEFHNKLREGYDVVYGVRKNRKENPVKTTAYWLFYRFMKNISRIDLPLDSGDFCMMSRKVVDYLNRMPEHNRYLRGMRAWIGFRQTGLEYERSARFAGAPKYTLKKLFELAYSGIFNFSSFPVKFITRLGILTILISLIYLTYVLVRKFYFNDVPTGFTALIISIVMFSGVQLIALGIIGEYVLRIYQQSQNRPLFIIDKIVCDKKLQDGSGILH